MRTIFDPLLVLLAKLTDPVVARQLKQAVRRLQFTKAENEQLRSLWVPKMSAKLFRRRSRQRKRRPAELGQVSARRQSVKSGPGRDGRLSRRLAGGRRVKPTPQSCRVPRAGTGGGHCDLGASW